MPDAWVTLSITTAAAVAASGLFLLTRRARPVLYANPREERLTRKLAQVVGCSLAKALPPNQSDETLVKRAVYHYQQELPETSCPVYKDKVRG